MSSPPRNAEERGEEADKAAEVMSHASPAADVEDLACLSVEQRIALWADLLDACEQFLLAGLRRQIGPNGDLAAAYRQWQEAERADHDEMIRHMVQELNRRSAGAGG